MKINHYRHLQWGLLLFLLSILYSCKTKKDPIPAVSKCLSTTIYYSELTQENPLLLYSLDVSENPREDTYVLTTEVDIAEPDIRKMKYVYHDDFIILYVYDANGNEIGKADTTWRSITRPTHSVTYTYKEGYGYNIVREEYTYNGDLLASIQRTADNSNGSDNESTDYFYYSGQDCIKKVSYFANVGMTSSDSTFTDYTYTTIGRSKDPLAGKYSYVFPLDNPGTKLLASSQTITKYYSNGIYSSSSDLVTTNYEYTFDSDTLIQKITSPESLVFVRYEPNCK